MPELEARQFTGTTFAQKLDAQRKQGGPPSLFNTDLDGTVYSLVPDRHTGQMEKQGDNRKAMLLLNEHSIPFMISTARSRWDTAQEIEIAEYGLTPPDIVSVGNGRSLLIRRMSGEMVPVQAYTERTRTPIRLNGNGRSSEAIPFNPEIIQSALAHVVEKHLPLGLTDVRVDNPDNPDGSYVTLDIKNMTVAGLSDLTRAIKTAVHGVKVVPAENIADLVDQRSITDPTVPKYSETFTGWVLVTPENTGKEGPVRFIGQQIGEVYGQPLTIHSVGDATVDVGMLLMGTGNRDPFHVRGYAVNNMTPLMRRTLENGKFLSFPRPSLNGERRAHFVHLPYKGPEAVLEVVRRMTEHE